MNDSTPSMASSSRRTLCGLSIANSTAGERLPVIASFPADVDDAAGIAALTEAAAVKAGLKFSDFMKLVVAEALWLGDEAPFPDEGPEQRKRSAHAHRPSYDWQGTYGSSAARLEFSASFHRMMYRVSRPAGATMTKASSRRAVLVRARAKLRTKIGARVLSNARIIEDADRLKQMYR